MRRVLSARERYELLSPWLVREADISVQYPHRPGADQVRGKGSQPVQPSPQEVVPEQGDWINQDWRNARDGGAFLSKVRPPMSSDIPHPTKLLNPNDKRQAAKLAYTQQSEDPDNDPWNVLAGSGYTFEDLVQNHLSHQMNMTPEQAYQGRVWYRAAHEATKDLADKTTGDHGRTVATMAAFSPKTDWDENMEKGHHFLTHYNGDPNFTIPGLQDHVEKAKSIYHAPDGQYRQINRGPKTSAFSRNILDASPMREPRKGEQDDAGYYQHAINPATGEPDWRLHPDQDSTIDTHHVRMSNTPHGADLQHLQYATPNYFGKKVAVDKKSYDPSYDLHARAAWEATRRANAMQSDPYRHLLPKQVQAGPWTKFKDDLDAAKGKHSPEPGVAPKSWPSDPTDEEVERWKGKHPLNNPIPRYERDQSNEWWNDPRRPQVHLRETPNWGRRRSHLGATSSPWWDHVLADYISRNPQYRNNVIVGQRFWQSSQHIAMPVDSTNPLAGNAKNTTAMNTHDTYRNAHKIMDEQGAPDGPRIDHGSGKVGVLMAPEIGHETYEPYWHTNEELGDTFKPTYWNPGDIPKGQYGRATSLNVLNVLNPQDRQNAITSIGDSMAPGGHAIITARKWSGDVDRSKHNANFPLPEEPNSVITGSDNDARYQHGYANVRELIDELQGHLGQGYTVGPAHHYVTSVGPDGKAKRRRKGIGAVGAYIIKHPMQI